MTIAESADARTLSRPAGGRSWVLSPTVSQPLFGTILVGAVGLSFFLADVSHTSQAAIIAGPDLTRLLRFMALIKAILALGAAGAVAWRLGSAVSIARFVTYGAASALMVTGPGLIWGMEHVGLGALFLHGGLAAVVMILWRDPSVILRLEAALIGRRSKR